MALIARSETAPLSHLTAAFCAFVGLLLASIVAGVLGPPARLQRAWTAYGCRDGGHQWDNSTCSGTDDLWTEGAAVEVESGALSPLNRFLALSVTPYYRHWRVGPNGNVVRIPVTTTMNVSYRDDTLSAWSPLASTQRKQTPFVCYTQTEQDTQGSCDKFTLAYQEVLLHRFYRIELRFGVAGGDLGDAAFALSWGSSAFSNAEMAVCLALVAVSGGLAAAWAWRMRRRHASSSSWGLEQRLVLALLFCLVLYNDPFIAVKYAAPGTGFLVFDSVCHALFSAALLFWWLVHFDLSASPDGSRLWRPSTLPKAALVLVFFALAASLSALMAARGRGDLVFGTREASGAVATLFVATSLAYIAGLVWACAMIGVAVPLLTESRTHLVRFLFSSAPALILAVSSIASIISGTNGALNKSSLDLLYFSVLNNSYVWLLVYGMWPVEKISSRRMSVHVVSTVDDGDDDDEQRPFFAGLSPALSFAH
eukprot:m51a1_g6259 hypothetical protein (481) ;mRNA; f:121255-123513